MKYLIAMLLVAGLGGLNIFLYKKNSDTPVPEGCEDLRPDCSACGIADCTLRKQFVKTIEE